MRISLNWLKDYLDIKPDLTINDISDSLTLAGLEVEGTEHLLLKSAKLLIGVVTAIKPLNDHELAYDLDADGMAITVSGPKSKIAIGMVVAFKPANDQNKPSALAGSLASYADLGLVLAPHDIIAFERDIFENGVPKILSEIKEFDDVIISLGITPNRADALSHLGVSRELCALLDINARSPMLTPREMAGPTHEKVTIEIDNSEDCPRYACRLIENVEIKESPYWMKLRLMASGIRPINNVVDVTNYVMLSRGQPLHAFDYEKLHIGNGRAKIIVKHAATGEKFIALDGQELTLSSDDVVISDGEKSLALAGVIGGNSSAITDSTTMVLLESAYFDPKNVRMTARRLGITTESSYRFERGADPNGVVDALNYAARLLTENSDAKVGREPIDAYRKRIDPIEIMMRPDRAQAVLGMDKESFDQDLLRKKFLRLGIETVAKRGDAIYFRVPTYRSDLTREIDLIEEAARMIGYDKVKSTSVGPTAASYDFGNLNLETVAKRLKEKLTSRGFSEAINYAFLNKEFHNYFLDTNEDLSLIEIKNPLSDRYGVMRLTLIPGLIKNLVHNQRNQEKSVQLFETGTVFLGQRDEGRKPIPSALSKTLDQDSFAREKQMMSGVLFGKTPFLAFDQPAKMIDFYHVKGVISEIFLALGLCDQYPNPKLSYEHGSNAVYLHPGESVTVRYLAQDSDNATILGHFGKLHPQIAASQEISGDVFVFELELERLANIMSAIPRFKLFSRYPTIERDVAFLVEETVNVGDILQAVESVPDAKNTLVSLQVFDVYRGKNIDKGKKSVAISLSLQKSDRTLTDEEAEDFVNQAVAKVAQETGARVR